MHKFGDCSFCGGEVKNDIVDLDYRYKGELYTFENGKSDIVDFSSYFNEIKNEEIADHRTS